MEGLAFLSGVVMGSLAMFCIVALLIEEGLHSDAMQEAYERGHAVQCLGETGYHWECEK